MFPKTWGIGIPRKKQKVDKEEDLVDDDILNRGRGGMRSQGLNSVGYFYP